SGGRSAPSVPTNCVGSQISRSVPVGTSKTQSLSTVSSGPVERRNTTRDPSALTVTARGSPALNPLVRAASSGYSPIAAGRVLGVSGPPVGRTSGNSTPRSSHAWPRKVGRVTADLPPERTLPQPEGERPAGSGPAILFVHAHPDDETIATGATMARYAAAGVHVTLVTCTLGEEGEIHVPSLAQLAADQADQLGGYRLVELERACAALGVTDHRFLGGAGRYRDSGMMGLPTNEHPRAFWQADLDEAAGHLDEVMREVRPQVVVTYDTNGGYGHPDHIQSHRVTMRAVELAREEGIGPAKVYWTAIPRSVLAAGMR